jgi:hypothetical protein
MSAAVMPCFSTTLSLTARARSIAAWVTPRPTILKPRKLRAGTSIYLTSTQIPPARPLSFSYVLVNPTSSLFDVACRHPTVKVSCPCGSVGIFDRTRSGICWSGKAGTIDCPRYATWCAACNAIMPSVNGFSPLRNWSARIARASCPCRYHRMETPAQATPIKVPSQTDSVSSSIAVVIIRSHTSASSTTSMRPFGSSRYFDRGA